MAGFFSKLFGGGGSNADGAQDGESQDYGGFTIRARPVREGQQWRLGGVILKLGESDEETMERHFVRADLFTSREEAESFALRKGKQIIDERGPRLFEDGEKTGRA